MHTIPILSPTTEMLRVKVLTLRIIQEMLETNHDLKWSNKDKVTDKTFWDILLDARTQDNIITKYLG